MGGAEYSLRDLMTFAASRARCHLVTSEPGPLAAEAACAGVNCHVVPCAMKQQISLREHLVLRGILSFGDVVAFLAYVVRLRRLVMLLDPDVIHANVPKSHVAVFLLAFLGYRGRCCFHFREIFEKRSAPYFVYSALFPGTRASIISISQAVHQSLPQRVRAKSLVIYNGVSIGKVLRPSTTGPAHLRLLYLGRVVPWKGCHMLVDVLARLRQRHSRSVTSLSIIGESSYWSQDYRQGLLTKINELGLAACCSVHGHTNAIAEEFARHDIFVNASRKEPFGRSVAEAQGSGMPVVAFDSGGIGEIVIDGETGFLVDYGDIDAFVNACGKFVQRPELAHTMGDKGFERARKCFNKEIQIPALWKYVRGNVG
jgi:glycosyltransferase involved in cell wall biosynthesis